MAITLTQGLPGAGMTLDIGPIAPVYDKHRFAPSNGAQYLRYLRMLAEELDSPPKGRKLPPDYDRPCYDVQCSLRRHATYLIEAGVRS